jgi:hypothetical protein
MTLIRKRLLLIASIVLILAIPLGTVASADAGTKGRTTITTTSTAVDGDPGCGGCP